MRIKVKMKRSNTVYFICFFSSFPRITIRKRQHKIVFKNFFLLVFTIWEHELMPVNRFVSPFYDPKLMSRALNHSPLYFREFFSYEKTNKKKDILISVTISLFFFSVLLLQWRRFNSNRGSVLSSSNSVSKGFFLWWNLNTRPNERKW